METSSLRPNPRVSVIMPSYNTAHLIAASLDSVLAQNFPDFEIIVVNDGSPDTVELERVLQPYLEKVVYVKQQNKRAGGARNTAINKARGEFLAFLDSDDAWLPGHLAFQMQMFKEDPQLDLVYCNCMMGDSQKVQEFMSQCPSRGPATFFALVEERCQIPISTVVARKSVLEKAGLFDENLARCDDFDMWVRAAFHGAKIGYSQRMQARLAGDRPGALGASRARMAEAAWKILQKADQTLPLTDPQRDVVRKKANELHAKYLLEEGKLCLGQRRFGEARKLLSEANSYFQSGKLSVVLFGLSNAPGPTSRLISLVQRLRG
jgi:glycosyltransferase involved in cell wall biosynthesis